MIVATETLKVLVTPIMWIRTKTDIDVFMQRDPRVWVMHNVFIVRNEVTWKGEQGLPLIYFIPLANVII